MLNSRVLVEFALIVAIATSGNPGGSVKPLYHMLYALTLTSELLKYPN